MAAKRRALGKLVKVSVAIIVVFVGLGVVGAVFLPPPSPAVLTTTTSSFTASSTTTTTPSSTGSTSSVSITASTSSTSSTTSTSTTSSSSTTTSATKAVFARDFVQILSQSSFVVIGYTNVVGEVKNIGPQNLDFVQVTVTFYDGQNNVIGTAFSFTSMRILTPNQKSPFKVISTKTNLIADHYTVAISDASFTTNQPNTSLKIQGATSNVDQIGYYHVVGQVTNTGSATASFVEVVVTFYDSGGKVIDTTFTFTSPTDLRQNEMGSFDANTRTNVNSIASFAAQVQAG